MPTRSPAPHLAAAPARRTPGPARPSAALLLAAWLSALPAWAQAPAHVPPKQEAQLNAGLPAPPADLDRSTPARSWGALLTACAAGKWDRAMHVLNLGDVSEGDRPSIGPVLARQLCQVLQATSQRQAGQLPDTAVGPLAEDRPRNYAVVATFAGPEGPQQAWLRLTQDGASKAAVWVLTRKSVSMIPGWFRRLVKKEVAARPAAAVINEGLGKLPAGLAAGSPRDTAATFMDLARQGDFAQAARLLDLRALPPAQQAQQGARLARRLFMVLKRIHPQGYGLVSNDPLGAPEKGVAIDEEVLARARLPEQELPLRLARHPRRDAAAVWLFSAQTVADIDALYGALGYGWAGDYLPPLFFELTLWQVQLWQWIGLTLALLLGLGAGYLGALATRRVLLRAARLTRWAWDDEVVRAMRGPLVVLYWVLTFFILRTFLALGEAAEGVLLRGCMFVGILALGWFLVRLVDVAAEFSRRLFAQREDDMAAAMVPVARKIVKALVSFIVVIVALQNMGMDVGGLLAGLGIGGLAFALAAKSTLENLFGGITIAVDRPFKVGDYVQVGSLAGTVEDLGLRSTRLRTVDRTVVTIPNGQLMDSRIENFSRRDKIRLLTTLGVQYDTTLDQLRYIVDELKRYLLAHPRVAEGFRVRFVGFGPSSLDVEVLAYVTSTDFAEFTGIREEIYLNLGSIVAEAGAQFAFPSQTVYVGQDGHADPDRAARAAAEVGARQRAGELCLPEIPDAVRHRLQRPGAPEGEPG